MRQTELRLANKDKRTIEAIRSKGWRMAREVNRAHVLSTLGGQVPEAQIMQGLGDGRTMIWRTRAAYLEGGLDHAVADMQRPGKPRRYRTDVEAQITALACSAPPARAKRWTLLLLERAAQAHSGTKQLSPETIRRLLKKKCLKTWRRLMWCIRALTEQYRQRRHELLALYARSHRESDLVVCLDEKSAQLLADSRVAVPMRPGLQARGRRHLGIH